MQKKPKLPKSCYPSEEAEDVSFLQRLGFIANKHPEVREIYHIHNEGKRGFRGMSRLAAHKRYLGGQRGLADWHLPVAQNCPEVDYQDVISVNYLSLYIEMKCQRGYYGTDKAAERAYSKEQRDWARRMTALGHKCVVCYGAEEAEKAILEYLGK